jgi:hypothetical protein
VHRTVATIVLIGVLGGPSLASGQEPIHAAGGFDNDRDGADLIGVLADSLKLLSLEHGSRIAFQEKTRRELGGPFWGDYRRSVRVPRQWQDTDAW